MNVAVTVTFSVLDCPSSLFKLFVHKSDYIYKDINETQTIALQAVYISITCNKCFNSAIIYPNETNPLPKPVAIQLHCPRYQFHVTGSMMPLMKELPTVGTPSGNFAKRLCYVYISKNTLYTRYKFNFL